MAAANLNTNKKKINYNTVTTGFTFTALNASDGGEYTVGASDSKLIFIVDNTDSSNAENVTIKSPANPALGVGTAFPDKVVSVAASSMGVIMVESVRFMDASGKITIKGSADVKVQVLEVE